MSSLLQQEVGEEILEQFVARRIGVERRIGGDRRKGDIGQIGVERRIGGDRRKGDRRKEE
ncbi:MAG: hypothetical protein ABH818_03120 [Patescibacteria group bacterium]|nr:hypothetical protein [Patescibacteria group bacterium]MBU1870948.1 hypothetical protein [Patescibacteria group bacterium]